MALDLKAHLRKMGFLITSDVDLGRRMSLLTLSSPDGSITTTIVTERPT